MSENAEQRHALFFQARMNAIYHERMEWWLSLGLNLTAFVSIVASSAAVMETTPAGWAAPLMGMVAVLNAGVLAFSVQRAVMDHGLLRRKWLDLAGEIERAGDAPLVELERRFHAINADEPPAWGWLLRRSHHAASEALGLS